MSYQAFGVAYFAEGRGRLRRSRKRPRNPTLYSSVYKKDTQTTHKSGHNRTVQINDNQIQLAADNATAWSDENHQRLNASKTQYMMFTLQLNCTLDQQITIKSDPIAQTTSAQLLGVKLDSHLKFATHVESCINKTRSAVHGLLTLKRHGVKEDMLVKFYKSRILPILTYACPAWYTYTPQYAKDKLEMHQSLCLRLIFPQTYSYTLRLLKAGVPPIHETFIQLCTKYVNKVVDDPSHRLHSLIPKRQSAIGRHSSRLRDAHVVHSNTALKCKSVFNYLLP